MAKGRPPAWQMFGNLDPSVWTQPLRFDDRGRLTLPTQVRERLAWFGTVEDGLLATLRGDGSVELTDWAEYGERTRAAVTERYRALPELERGKFALAAMDRFMRVGLEANVRLALPPALTMQVDPQGSGFVRVLTRDGSLFLWDDEIWRTSRSERIKHLENLGRF